MVGRDFSFDIENVRQRSWSKMNNISGVFHLMYVDEKDEKKDKGLKSLQTDLKKLTRVGIAEGLSSINKDYRETMKDVRQKMFPRQTPSEVLSF